MPLRRIPPGSKYGDEDKYSAAEAVHAQGMQGEAIKMLGEDCEPPALVRKARWLGEMALMDPRMKDDEKLRLCKEAVSIAQQAIDKDPTYPVGYKDLAVALGRVTQLTSFTDRAQLSKDTKVAIDKAIELDPDESTTWLLLGKWNVGMANLNWVAQTAVTLLYGGQLKASYEEAIRCFLRAEECFSNPMNLYELGQVYLMVNKREEAKEALMKAIASNGDVPVYREAIENAKELLRKEFPEGA